MLNTFVNYDLFFLFKISFFQKYNTLFLHYLINNNLVSLNFFKFFFVNHFFKKLKLKLISNSLLPVKIYRNRKFFFKLNTILKPLTRGKRYHFFKFFRFNKFFSLILLKNLKKKKVFIFYYSKLYKNFKFYPNFYHNYSKILHRNWNFLIGGLLSPIYWELLPKKDWLKTSVAVKLIKNRWVFSKKNKRKKKIRKVLSIRFLKKLIISNFFYIKKLNLNFNKLAYLLKLKSRTKKKNVPDWHFSRPYLFINNSNTYKSSHSFSNHCLNKLFFYYIKIFKSIKRITPKNYVRINSIFRIFNFRKKFFFKRRFYTYFSTRQYPARKVSIFTYQPLIINKKAIHKYKKLKFTKYRRFLRSLWRLTITNKARIRKYSRTLKMYSKLIFLSFLFLSKFPKKKFFFLKYKKKIKKVIILFFLLNYSKKRSKNFFWYNYFRLLKFSNSTLYTFKFYKTKNYWNYYPLCLSYIWNFSIKKFFKYQNNLNIYKWSFGLTKNFFSYTKSHIYNIFKLPYYISKERVLFVLNKYGFLYTFDIYNFSNYKNLSVYNLKRILYSFSYKNDLQRYILKRYAKYRAKINFLKKNKNTIASNLNMDLLNFNNLNSNNFFDTNINFIKNISQFGYLVDKSLKHKNYTSRRDQLLYWKTFVNDDWMFNIKRIRFKPGYMSLWRNARAALKFSLNLKMRYQYKLTRYLCRYNKLVKFKILLMFEMKLENILVKSRFVPDFSVITLILKNGLVFVNGSVCLNPHFQIFVGDFIQLIISLKYYILWKWLVSWSIKKRIRLRNLASKKLTISSSTEKKTKSHKLPKWIMFSKHSIGDISKYLEVDYFTLSLMIIYEPFMWLDINPYTIIDTRYSIINMYNWKYIT